MDSQIDSTTAKALLEWQIDMGVTEAISETPINRYEVPKAAPKAASKAAPGAASEPTTQAKAPMVAAAPKTDVVAEAKALATGAGSLSELAERQAAFPHCALKQGARNFVFADGTPTARVMIIGEAPGRDEDREAKPFVGPAGQLLDQMLAAIEHGRAHEENPVYITNILPWRPPQNRDPEPDEIAMMLPFVEQHVALVNPDVLVLMGNISCLALMGTKGITRLRGKWAQVCGKPALPMFHPAYLLRNPAAKRDAWHDLLMLQAKLRDLA